MEYNFQRQLVQNDIYKLQTKSKTKQLNISIINLINNN